jgi:hypothetical protein
LPGDGAVDGAADSRRRLRRISDLRGVLEPLLDSPPSLYAVTAILDD